MSEMAHAPASLAALAAVRDVTRALLRGEDPEYMLVLIASSARRLVAADVAMINCTDGDPETMQVRVAVGRNAGRLRGTSFPVAASLSGHVMRTGLSEVVEDARSDPRTHTPAVLRGGFGPALYVPLVCREGPCGTLCVANRVGGPTFDAHDLDVVETFAGQASLVLDTVRSEERLQQLLATADRERTGRTLHDTVIQRLFATGMTLEAARAGDLPPAAAAQVARALDDLDATIRQIRATVFGPGATL
jgi:GAF domain-containing protein